MGRYSGKSCRLIFMIVLTVAFFFAEIIAGYVGNSIALVSDAFNMLSDLLSLIVGLASARLSRRAPSGRRTYGLPRAEVVGAFGNAVFLAALCFSISLEALKRLAEPDIMVDPLLVLIVGALGLAVNIVGLFIFQDFGCCRRGRGRGARGSCQGPPEQTERKDEENEAGAPVLSDDVTEQEGKEKEGQPLNIRGAKIHLDQKEVLQEQGLHWSRPVSQPSSLCQATSLFCLTHIHLPCLKYLQPRLSSVYRRPAPCSERRSRFRGGGDNLGTVLRTAAAAQGTVQFSVLPGPHAHLGHGGHHHVLCCALVQRDHQHLAADEPRRCAARHHHLHSLLFLALSGSLSGPPLSTPFPVEDISKIHGVRGVHEVHVWELIRGRNVATLHVKCADTSTFDALSHQVRKVFHQAGVHSVTIQPEFEEEGGANACCSTPCISPTCQELSCCRTPPSPPSVPNGHLPMPSVEESMVPLSNMENDLIPKLMCPPRTRLWCSTFFQFLLLLASKA